MPFSRVYMLKLDSLVIPYNDDLFNSFQIDG